MLGKSVSISSSSTRERLQSRGTLTRDIDKKFVSLFHSACHCSCYPTTIWITVTLWLICFSQRVRSEPGFRVPHPPPAVSTQRLCLSVQRMWSGNLSWDKFVCLMATWCCAGTELEDVKRLLRGGASSSGSTTSPHINTGSFSTNTSIETRSMSEGSSTGSPNQQPLYICVYTEQTNSTTLQELFLSR